MRLYFKVLLAALIPIFLLTAQSLWQVGRIIDAQNDSVERSYQLEGRLVAARAQERPLT